MKKPSTLIFSAIKICYCLPRYSSYYVFTLINIYDHQPRIKGYLNLGLLSAQDQSKYTEKTATDQ